MAQESKRSADHNGFMYLADNPVSKIGVYPYLGSEIPVAGLDPEKVYGVYRPAEELGKDSAIESAKLQPFIDNHAVLGKNGMPAERKGIQGYLGEQVRFDGIYLRSNIKIPSAAAQSLIEAGKIELSPAYYCDWSPEPGVFDGQPYQFTQRNILFNHLALVDEGRTGPDVAIQDSKIMLNDRHMTMTLDSKELLPMALAPEDMEAIKTMVLELLAAKDAPGDVDPAKDPAADMDPAKDEDVIVDPVEVVPTPEQAGAAEEAVAATEEAQAAIEEVASAIEEVASAAEEVVAAADGNRKPAQDKLTKAKAKLATARAKHGKLAADAKIKATLAKDGALARQVKALQDELKAIKEKPAQDSGLALITQVADRDALAKQVAQHIGVFDASRMTADGVAKYAVDKLSIKCAKGHEAIALDAWMQGRKPAHETIARDSGPKTGAESAHSLWEKK